MGDRNLKKINGGAKEIDAMCQNCGQIRNYDVLFNLSVFLVRSVKLVYLEQEFRKNLKMNRCFLFFIDLLKETLEKVVR